MNWEAPCVCGDPRGEHRVRKELPDGQCRLLTRLGPCLAPLPKATVGRCRCQKFRSPTRGTKRSTRKYAITQQGQWAKAAGFYPREGHGADAVYLSPGGGSDLLAEHKHQRSFRWAEVEAAMQQAEVYARHEQGKPFPCVGYTTKPGTGREAKRYIVFRAEDWQAIVERLRDG